MTDMPDRLPDNLENIVLKEYSKVSKEFTIKCDNCKKPLVIVGSDNNGAGKRIQAECVTCNTKSFIHSAYGRVFIGLPEGAELIDIDNEILRVRPRL